jgi:hypothetical protein
MPDERSLVEKIKQVTSEGSSHILDKLPEVEGVVILLKYKGDPNLPYCFANVCDNWQGDEKNSLRHFLTLARLCAAGSVSITNNMLDQLKAGEENQDGASG